MKEQLIDHEPSINEVIQFIYDFSYNYDRGVITEYTLLEKDLGICGDDGVELLLEAERIFNLDFDYGKGFEYNFGLSENEYLFTGEGANLIGMLLVDLLTLLRLSKFPIIKRLLNSSADPIIRDLSVRELHRVICNIKQQMNSDS